MSDVPPTPVDLERTFLDHRSALLGFLRSRNAGDQAEDILHDLWLRLPREDRLNGRQIHSSLSYLYRMANMLMIDRHRQRTQSAMRDARWTEATGPVLAEWCEQPTPERAITAQQSVDRIMSLLSALGPRVFRVFHRHRVDGLTQREVALELGVSIGTVEGDLKRAYTALAAFRAEIDKAGTR